VHHLSQVPRGIAFLVLVALVVVAGNSSSGTAAGRAERPAAATGVTAQVALVGTWQRVTTCAELTTALTKAGLHKFVLEAVAGNGFIPGVTTPDQIDPANPCKGAVPRRHSHFFTKDRKFGSLDWRGQPVDDGTYRLVSNRTVVIFKEFPRVTFNYRIRGKTVTFAPVIRKGCSTFRCAWAVSMAYPGKTWQRVR
jgi:hypothetical protein